MGENILYILAKIICYMLNLLQYASERQLSNSKFSSVKAVVNPHIWP